MNTHTDATKSEVALREEEMLAFWRAHNVFKKSIETPAGSTPVGDFVFYDGPPFATGTPHYGHILAGTIKDAIPRFWTMNGKRVLRRWGWDCHGLPLENLIEKRLGLSTKRDIEEMGVKQFNETARGAVLEYADYWKEVVPRLGRFVDMDNDYRTMDPHYTESVWWVFSELHKKGLVFEGFKSMHLCPRCGTTLSNFEVNQGYKDIKDIAVTVKMPFLDEEGNPTNTSILIWTTTPWTLPGNIAVAVHKEITYVQVKVTIDEKDEHVILAKERLSQLGTDAYTIETEMTGASLLGKTYRPPFATWQGQEFSGKENAWKIYHAEYVSTDDGTGVVHIAPAYGDEDMELAKREGLPVMHHVDSDGRFMAMVKPYAGQLVKPKDDEKSEVTHLDADIEIVKSLKEQGVLVRKENITHSYPHCWRCDTPLLNYATTSWFIDVPSIKDLLVTENARVRWVPEHVGTNRFGKWLEGARDWAVSRQRYWGAPLPIWKNTQTGACKVFGSLSELQSCVPKSGNTYLLMRHGESEYNTKGMLNASPDIANSLTHTGTAQVEGAIEMLKKQGGVDIMYYSPLARTAETAQQVARALGLSSDACIADERLREMEFGVFECQHVDAYHAFFGERGVNRLRMSPEGGESWTDVKKRIGLFLYEIERVHAGKRILIISHNGPLQTMQAVASGIGAEAFGEIIEHNTYDLQNAEVREMTFVPMPHNDAYELDFHRPYIDDVKLVDTDGEALSRIPDVFDCWFESGSMPYGQHAFVGDPLSQFDPARGVGYPAHFIAEGLDQTRGWFYSLMVLGVALFGKSPYEQVIVNGLVLAEDGKKMSKSLQNYPDPVELVDRVGADAMRMYLLSSPAVRGEDLRFSEKEVLELQRKNIGRLHNVLHLYEMYAGGEEARDDSPHILDAWIVARLRELTMRETQGFIKYELDRATRPIEDFIDDLSVWYVRRSRERLKGDDAVDKAHALSTLRFVLRQCALVMAPTLPFYAEYLFQHTRMKHDAESVHLAEWPKDEEIDEQVIAQMVRVRALVTLALQARTKANIKVRQPLARLTIAKDELLTGPYLDIIKDELNVKECDFADAVPAEYVALDTIITPELKQEGVVRELMRATQDTRKQLGLVPHDSIHLMLDSGLQSYVQGFEPILMSVCGVSTIMKGEDLSESLVIDDTRYTFSIRKV